MTFRRYLRRLRSFLEGRQRGSVRRHRATTGGAAPRIISPSAESLSGEKKLVRVFARDGDYDYSRRDRSADRPAEAHTGRNVIDPVEDSRGRPTTLRKRWPTPLPSCSFCPRLTMS
jgi:hypothetical protein